jgi:hypothetical protein
MTTTIIKACKRCGKEFKYLRHYEKNKRGFYCSRECWNKQNSENHKKVNDLQLSQMQY